MANMIVTFYMTVVLVAQENNESQGSIYVLSISSEPLIVGTIISDQSICLSDTSSSEVDDCSNQTLDHYHCLQPNMHLSRMA